MLVYSARTLCSLNISVMITQLCGILVGFSLRVCFPLEMLYCYICAGKVLWAEDG